VKTKGKITPPEEIEVEDLSSYLKHLPETRYRPLVNGVELREIIIVFKGLPELEYPIESGGELIEKLGGPKAVLDMEGMKIGPWRMIKYLPAYYFPIVSIENFIEKMSELIKENRKQVNVPEEIERIRKQLPDLEYPIKTREMLVKVFGKSFSAENRFQFQGGPVTIKEVTREIPDDYFPIDSEDDFIAKATRLMVSRPLLVKE
jgi:hypothetical protein